MNHDGEVVSRALSGVPPQEAFDEVRVRACRQELTGLLVRYLPGDTRLGRLEELACEMLALVGHQHALQCAARKET